MSYKKSKKRYDKIVEKFKADRIAQFIFDEDVKVKKIKIKIKKR